MVGLLYKNDSNKNVGSVWKLPSHICPPVQPPAPALKLGPARMEIRSYVDGVSGVTRWLNRATNIKARKHSYKDNLILPGHAANFLFFYLASFDIRLQSSGEDFLRSNYKVLKANRGMLVSVSAADSHRHSKQVIRCPSAAQLPGQRPAASQIFLTHCHQKADIGLPSQGK